MRGILFYLFLIVFFSCSGEKVERNSEYDESDAAMKEQPAHEPGASTGTQEEVNSGSDSKATFSVFRNEDGLTYGYDIFIDGKKFIHQSNIPARSGKSGFRSEEDAIKVAAIAVEKINRGGQLPTITTEELDSLGIR